MTRSIQGSVDMSRITAFHHFHEFQFWFSHLRVSEFAPDQIDTPMDYDYFESLNLALCVIDGYQSALTIGQCLVSKLESRRFAARLQDR